jgi:toxin CcdB
VARFHVYLSTEGGGHLLDVQANLLDHLNTRIVVPLLRLDAAPKPAKLLNPIFEIEGVSYMMATQFMAAVPLRLLGEDVASLLDDASTVVNALDCLFQGI